MSATQATPDGYPESKSNKYREGRKIYGHKKRRLPQATLSISFAQVAELLFSFSCSLLL